MNEHNAEMANNDDTPVHPDYVGGVVLFDGAPLPCYGRTPTPMAEPCAQCRHLDGCGRLALERIKAGIDASSQFLPANFELPGMAGQESDGPAEAEPGGTDTEDAMSKTIKQDDGGNVKPRDLDKKAEPEKAAAKKQTAKKQTAKKQTAKKQTAKKQTAKKQTAKKQTAKKQTAKKQTEPGKPKTMAQQQAEEKKSSSTAKVDAGGVVETIDDARMESMAAKLVALHQQYQSTEVKAKVALAYEAGPLLVEIRDHAGFDRKAFAAWLDHNIGYGVTEGYLLMRVFEKLPEATYRKSLEKMPSSGVIDRLMRGNDISDPSAWIRETHYVPRRKKHMSIYDMTAADMADAVAVEKEARIGSGAAARTQTDKASAKGKEGIEARVRAGAVVEVLRRFEAPLAAYDKIEHVLDVVTPDAVEAGELRELQERISAVSKAIAKLVDAHEKAAKADAEAPVRPSITNK